MVGFFKINLDGLLGLLDLAMVLFILKDKS